MRVISLNDMLIGPTLVSGGDVVRYVSRQHDYSQVEQLSAQHMREGLRKNRCFTEPRSWVTRESTGVDDNPERSLNGSWVQVNPKDCHTNP